MSSIVSAFSEKTLRGGLSQENSFLRFAFYDTLPSTNTTAKEFAKRGEAEGLVVLAQSQTQGRGRENRSFFSPSHSGLYMSILLRPQIPAADSFLITTAAAVATAEAIEEVCRTSVDIKWVNDLWMNGKKVCGILTEASLASRSSYLEYAVLGIGVNLTPPSEGFPNELKNIATAVLPQADSDLRCSLAAAILNHFYFYYKQFPENSFWKEYKKRLFFLGKEIFLLKNNQLFPVIALDLDERFRLKIRHSGGKEEWLSSGEIRIKV